MEKEEPLTREQLAKKGFTIHQKLGLASWSVRSGLTGKYYEFDSYEEALSGANAMYKHLEHLGRISYE